MKFIPGHQGYLTVWTDERKAKWSKQTKGTRMPDETRRKISETTRARKARRSGYLTIYAPSHPRAAYGRTLPTHIMIAEQKIGRALRTGEVVHHIDGDKTNNAPDNLAVLPSHRAHAQLHHALDPDRRHRVLTDPATGRFLKTR